MPYKHEYDKAKLPKEQKQRVKLRDCQRAIIPKLYATGKFSQRKLAKEFEVSRRLIQFIIDPEKGKVCREQYKERRKDGRYYNKEYHTKAMKNHRAYKKNKVKENLIILFYKSIDHIVEANGKVNIKGIKKNA